MDAPFAAALAILTTGPWPAILGVAAALVGLAVLDARLRAGPRARIEARLAAMLAREVEDDPSRPMADAAVFEARRPGLRGAVTGWLADISANIGGRGALRVLFALTAVAGVGAYAVAAALVGEARGLTVGAAATVLTFYIVQAEMRRRWKIAFLDQLVEGVELLTRSVRAGYAAPAAIRLVGREIDAPVGPVFAQIANEDDLGVEMRHALRRAAARVNLPDFTFLTIAMAIQRETGGQIGDSLDNLHMVLRKRKEARLKIAALTAEGRMSAMIVGAIPIVAGVGVYALNPEQTSLLFEPGLGQTMLGVAIGLWVSGMLIVRWMVKAQP